MVYIAACSNFIEIEVVYNTRQFPNSVGKSRKDVFLQVSILKWKTQNTQKQHEYKLSIFPVPVG